MLLMLSVPLGAKAALPPKMLLVLLATVPKTLLVAYNWLPLMASVLVAVICPAATFWIWRFFVPSPTLTTSPVAGAEPANPAYVMPPIAAAAVAWAAVVVLPAPSATDPPKLASELAPKAVAFIPDAIALYPKAEPPCPVEDAACPTTVECAKLALEPEPIAIDS